MKIQGKIVECVFHDLMEFHELSVDPNFNYGDNAYELLLPILDFLSSY